MKRANFSKLVRIAGLFALIFVLATALFGHGVSDVGDFVSLAVAAPVAGSGVTTTNTKSSSSELLLDDIDSKIVEIERDTVPLDTMIRKINNRQTNKSLKIDFYTVDVKEISDTVRVAVTASDQLAFELPINNTNMWDVGDTVFVEGVSAYSAANAESALGSLELFVYDIDKANQKVMVQPVNGFRDGNQKATLKTGDNIALDTLLVRGGRAGHEEEITTGQYADMPYKEYNYVQKFMAEVRESTWSKMHAKEVEWGFDDFERRQLANLRIEKEISYLRGFRNIINATSDGKERYLTGGALEFITGYSTLSKATLSNPNFQTLTKEIFAGNGGSDQRVMLCGDGALEAMGKIDDITKQSAAKKRETNFGLTFNRINTNFGELLIVRHPLFARMGWTDRCLTLDMNNVHERYFEPRREITHDLRAAAIADADSKVFIETSCPLFKYPESHRWVDFTA